MTNPSGVFTSSPSYSYDSELKQCTIRNADTFPAKVFELADDIERLDMSFGHLTSLPDNLGDLKNLKVVNFAHNSFTEIPSVLSSCDKLEVAIFTSCHVNRFDDAAMPASIRGITLTNNELTEIPSSIAAYKKLQKLTLAGNKIKKLPYELLDCPELAMLRLAVNDIDKSPDWLFQHPRLAWYTDSGNHIDKSRDACKQVLRNIPWSDITIAEMVGESSKNTVFRGTLFSGEAVAVKLFGGALSTDGIPEDEMTASLLGSNHAQLIGGLGKVVDGPAGQQGLVMPLVPPEFKNLGLPPSYETLLRDTYPAGTSLSVRYISRVLADIASAMQHLSSGGVMHGDIYSHNILSNENGQSYLGDFGAASVYDTAVAPEKLREKIDVLGFGYLLEDLLSVCPFPDSDEPSTVATLQSLLNSCLNRTVSSRPSFADITELLSH